MAYYTANTTLSFQASAVTGTQNRKSVSTDGSTAMDLGARPPMSTISKPQTPFADDRTCDVIAHLTAGKLDGASKVVNVQRSELVAISKRLNQNINDLTNISSNLSAAKGGIEDADFALETTNLAKNQILQQASTAMLAQANASKQNVLSLLQG